MDSEEDYDEDLPLEEINSELLSSHQSHKMMVYGLYAMIYQHELHLDRITHKYKYMSLTWLLATFVGIGFFFSSETSQLPINKHFISCIVGFFGVVGVLSFWYLDICIYQMFWGSFYITEIKFEKKHPFLGKLINKTLLLDTLNARFSGNSLFYIISLALLIVIIGVSAFFLMSQLFYKIAIVIVILAFGFFVLWILRSTCKKLIQSLQTEL